MKTYQLRQLPHDAQLKAAKDYIQGWHETHPKDPLGIEEALEILDHTEDEYLSDGTFIKQYGNHAI